MTLDLIQGPANHHLCAQSSELPIFIIKVLFNRATLYFIYCIWLFFYSGSPTPPPSPKVRSQVGPLLRVYKAEFGSYKTRLAGEGHQSWPPLGWSCFDLQLPVRAHERDSYLHVYLLKNCFTMRIHHKLPLLKKACKTELGASLTVSGLMLQALQTNSKVSHKHIFKKILTFLYRIESYNRMFSSQSPKYLLSVSL